MADDTGKTRLEQVVAILRKHDVEFIVIGGEAATLHGSPLATFDSDLCYRRSAENLRRLAAALREIRPTLRGAPPDLPFTLDERALALGCNYTFSTPLGDLDLLGEVEPIGRFEDLKEHAEQMDFDGAPLDVIGLDDLIRIKEYISRPKDRAVLYQLLAIRKIRGGTGR